MESISLPSSSIHKKQMIVTPFQIFCYQNREIAQQMNPHLKGTTITSLLAKMWRSMDPVQKQHFEEMSFALRGSKNVFPMLANSIKPCQKSTPVPIIPIDQLVVPKINIIPHRLFGVNAAEASQLASKQANKV